MRYNRQHILARLSEQIVARRPIVAAGAGTGMSAKMAEAGGADLIVVYNSGRYRMAGHASAAGLLAFGDANQIVQDMGEREILPVVRSTPVVAGVMGTDPTRQMALLLTRLDNIGYSGVINFPSVGVIDGRFRQRLETTNLGFGREVEMMGLAHLMGFFTCAYVFDAEQARAMADVGVDAIIAHLETTVGGDTGVAPELVIALEDAPAVVQTLGAAARAVNSEVLVLCHGGPIATPEDAAYVLEHSDAVGFVGASSVERLPVEDAIQSTVARFKSISLRRLEATDGRGG